jgi:hypothetical protein
MINHKQAPAAATCRAASLSGNTGRRQCSLCQSDLGRQGAQADRGRACRKGAIVAAMPLTPHQRRDLLRIEQSRDAAAITDAINQVLADNPDTDLLEIEMVFRAAASTAFLVADGAGFRIVIGVQAWVAELDRLGRTPEQNRQALAGELT